MVTVNKLFQADRPTENERPTLMRVGAKGTLDLTWDRDAHAHVVYGRRRIPEPIPSNQKKSGADQAVARSMIVYCCGADVEELG
jgi:hypothetical protein